MHDRWWHKFNDVALKLKFDFLSKTKAFFTTLPLLHVHKITFALQIKKTRKKS